jgi:hypothetical protein
MTWDRLERHAGAIGARPNLNFGDRGPGVKLLQKILKVPQTSVFDQATRKAVDVFQRKQGWNPSGVGKDTWKALDALALEGVTIEAELETGDGSETGTIDINLDPDPRRSSLYIDKRVEAVGWGLYVGTLSGEPGSFLVWCHGLTDPILLPFRLTRFEKDPRTPIGKDGHGDAVYGSREEAMKAVSDPEREVAFFPTVGGMLAPTIFTPNTTPRLMATAEAAFDETIAEVQAELTLTVLQIVTRGMATVVLRALTRVGVGRGGPLKPKTGAGNQPSASSNRISVGQAMKMEAEFRAEIRTTRNKLVSIPGSTKEAQGGVGPVLSGCLDKRTGEIFYSVNQGKVPMSMHPLLKARYEGYLAGSGGVTPPRAGVPGAHSEVGALNKALWARDPAGKMTTLPEGEFTMHNASLYRNKPEGVPPMCTNCSGIIPPQVKFLE